MSCLLNTTRLVNSTSAFYSAIPPNSSVNRLLCRNIASGKFVTFCYAVIDLEQGQVSYANAGHNAPFIVRTDGSIDQLTDPKKYGKYVDGLQNLDIKTIASCHSPVIEGEYIDKAFAHVREFPNLDAPMMPDQSILDQIIAATSQPPA